MHVSQGRDAVGRAQAWAGGTFLHHLLPKHVRTGPALPACLLTQASRSQARLSSPPPPTLNLLPFQFSSSRAPWAGVGDEEPWQKPRREMKIHLPQMALSRAL